MADEKQIELKYMAQYADKEDGNSYLIAVCIRHKNFTAICPEKPWSLSLKR